MKKPLHIFDFNGTLVGRDLGPGSESHALHEIFEPLFSTLSAMSAEDWEKHFPEAAAVGLTPETARERLLPIIANPPKFTPARTAYYHVIEGEIRNGKIDVGLSPDTVAEGSVLARLKAAGIDAMVLSRGTRSLISAILDVVPELKQYIAFFDSTIPYGNTKNKETYLTLYKSLGERGYVPAATYDDEVQFVKELYLASREYAKTDTPFKVYWINRENASEETLWNLFPEEEREEAKKGIRIRPNLLFDPLAP